MIKRRLSDRPIEHTEKLSGLFNGACEREFVQVGRFFSASSCILCRIPLIEFSVETLVLLFLSSLNGTRLLLWNSSASALRTGLSAFIETPLKDPFSFPFLSVDSLRWKRLIQKNYTPFLYRFVTFSLYIFDRSCPVCLPFTNIFYTGPLNFYHDEKTFRVAKDRLNFP